MEKKQRVIFITIVPSPYQRDFFASMAARDDLDLEVYYMEAATPDSPWPAAPLRSFEHILPGFWLPLGPARFHFNWRLPDFSKADFVVLSSFTSWTVQWLMRWVLREKRWLFWGERLRAQPSNWKAFAQKKLVAPLARAAGIVGIGREAENDYARRFPGTPHFCIPYHCDLTAFQASRRNRIAGGPFTFFFCGQMIRRKGVDLLLLAFDRLIAKGMDANLLLVGREADLPEFLAAVSPRTRTRIRYEGFQSPELLPPYFSQADAFVLPSRHDGWGVVINQALGAGLPVISSDAAGAGMDLVEEGVNGLRFAAGDVDGLMRAMERLATNPETARAWGEASGQKAPALAPEAGAEKWARVFKALTGSGTHPKTARGRAKLRILLVSSGSGSRGGGEIFLDYLGQGLADRGHEVLMWIPAHPRMNELAERCSRFSRIIRADYRNTYDYLTRSIPTCLNWGVSRRIAREWEELRPDIIHLNKQNLEDGLDLLRAAGQCAAPSVCTIHLTQTARYLRAKFPALRDWIARNALMRYSGVFVAVLDARRAALDEFLSARVRSQTIHLGVADADREAVDGFFRGHERTKTIIYGVSPVNWETRAPRHNLSHARQTKRSELGLNDGDFLVVGLGRLVEQKRPFLFLETARKLHQYFPATKFLWVGDGHLLKKWKEWVAREKLEDVIFCAGWQADPGPFLLAGDLLLHVAEYEGLPLAILEAMTAGLPCAVTRSLAEEIPLFDEKTVLFADDPVLLAERLQTPSELDAVASRAKQLVENQLSLRNMVESYERLYEGVGRG